MTEYTIIEQILGTIFVILLIIFIIGKKLGVKWFRLLKMLYKGNWKEEWKSFQKKEETMKEKKHTLVGWKELPLYLLHPKMLITKEWPFTEWWRYDEKTNTIHYYHWMLIKDPTKYEDKGVHPDYRNAKSNWIGLLHLLVMIPLLVVRVILAMYLIGLLIFWVIIPLITIILNFAESASK